MRFMTLVLSALLALLPIAGAQAGDFGVGLRAGPSFYTQDINEREALGVPIEGDTGLLLSFQGFYRADQWWTVGLALEYETHGVTILDLEAGDVDTVTVLPYIEVRPWNGTLVPYAIAGIGGNFNSFNESDLCTALVGDCAVETDDTFAVRVGAGADYFIASNVSLNAELGWKLNSGDMEDSAGNTADMNLSAFSVLFGGRLLF